MLALGGAAIGSALTYYALNTSKDEGDETTEDVFKKKQQPSVVTRGAFTASAVESEGLLTGILTQMWDNINVAGCQAVRDAVEPALKESLPAPLNTLHFTKLDLGKNPLRLENILVHEKKGDTLQFDMDIVWDGQCEIELKADYVGRVGVRTIKFRGRMGVVLKPLTSVLPIAGAAQYFFIDPPLLDLDFTGLAQIADTAVVNKTIRKVIDDTLASMLVLPNRMMAKVDPAQTILSIHKPPLGVARVSVLKGTGFKTEKRALRSDDVPDVFVDVCLGTAAPYKTKTMKNSNFPVWEDETADFLLFDYGQTLQFHVWDEDTGAIDSNDEIGKASVSVQELLLSPGGTMSLPIQGKSGKGAFLLVRCDLFPLTSTTLSSLTSQTAKPKDIGGLLTVLVSQAFDVPADTSTFVRVTYGEQTFNTATVTHGVEGIDATNPAFDGAYTVPLIASEFLKERHDVVIELMNPGKEAKVLGTTFVTHSELSRAENSIVSGKRLLENSPSVSLECMVSYQGIDFDAKMLSSGDVRNVTSEADSPQQSDDVPDAKVEPPATTETIKVTVLQGEGFKVEKRRLKKSDVPDIYLVVQVGSKNKPWKTQTIDNSTAPVWNETAAFLLDHHHDTIHIEAFDYDKGKLDKDDKLGFADISVGQVLLAGGMMKLDLKDDNRNANGASVSLRCERS